MKKFKSSLKPALKRVQGNKTSSNTTESVPSLSEEIPNSLFLSIPAELRLAVYDYLHLVDQLVLRWTCQTLRNEIAASPPPSFSALSDEDSKALQRRVRLDRFVKLCDQGKDQSPDPSRALCSACLTYHKLDCFFEVTLQQAPRWRVCKKDALLRLCPCLCIQRTALANLKNTMIWATGQTPIDLHHLCGLIKGVNSHGSIDLTCASGWWDLIAYLSIKYECDTTGANDTNGAVDSFLASAAEARLSLCPHMTADDKETADSLKQLYHKSRLLTNISGAMSCHAKHCETSVSWTIRRKSVSLKVKRQLGDIWKQSSLNNDKWLAQVANPDTFEHAVEERATGRYCIQKGARFKVMRELEAVSTQMK